MHREGMNEDNATAEDFLCDFCHNHWADNRPMVEGHRGSLICGPCLTVAYREVVLGNGGEALAEREVCTLCLAPTSDPVWVSPAFAQAKACRKCLKQSAGVLQKDVDSGWMKPAE